MASTAGNTGNVRPDFDDAGVSTRAAELLELIAATDQIVVVASASGVIEYANPAASEGNGVR